MRCQRCQFENIPGQKVCIQCRSALEINKAEIDIHPPRMSKWKRPFRNFFRAFRKNKISPDFNFNSPQWLKDSFTDNSIALFLSVIPGLPYILQKRFNQIKWHFLAWTFLIITGLFFYGSSTGLFLIGLAVGLHTCMAVQNGILNDLAYLRSKIVVTLLVLAALSLIYRFVPPALVPNLRGGFASITVPYYDVSAGDYLLTWRNVDLSQLQRGNLIMVNAQTIRNYQNGYNAGRGISVISQVIAFQGENLVISGNTFIVNGQKLDPERYPVPEWLQNRKFSTIIPENSYFVNSNYRFSGYAQQLTSGNILDACLVSSQDIQARAFMRWMPLTKRGFIR